MSQRISRKSFLSALGLGMLATRAGRAQEGPPPRPNIILAMSDDQGWGDAGYQGHPHLKTPALDEMAATGVRFERFYSAAPVCSPTRGSCLTGRHPFRYGILGANAGDYDDPSRYPLPLEEVTLAKILREAGYTTGHFGKWRLGDFSGPARSTPADHGFDVSFSTVRKVPTTDPFGYYLNGEPFTEPLKGDDSAVIMDRALEFIDGAAKPFFAVIWFHSPHNPVIATEEYRAMYANHPEGAQHFWGTLTALDAQMGRLRRRRREKGAAANTMLWFCSDNGPARGLDTAFGVTNGLREAKGSLYEGGIRVLGLLEWPRMFPGPKRITTPCVTSDYLPTILEWLDASAPARPLDGESLAPLLAGESSARRKPIAFEHGGRVALIDGAYKLYGVLNGDAYDALEVYNLEEDPAESRDLAAQAPEKLAEWTETHRVWRESVKRSAAGGDYV